MMGHAGSGKGTQAELIRSKYGHNYISTGDLIREMIKKAASGNMLGKQVKDRYDRGEPQPDDLILKSVRQKLSELELEYGLIFDAFPLSMEQAKGLDEIVKEYSLPDPVAVNIEVSEEEVVQRLGMRKYCPNDNSVYYPKSPTYFQNKCAKCGGDLAMRADDVPEVVRERYRVYKERIDNLIDYYKKRNRLININGEQSVDDVSKEILEKFSAFETKQRA